MNLGYQNKPWFIDTNLSGSNGAVDSHCAVYMPPNDEPNSPKIMQPNSSFTKHSKDGYTRNQQIQSNQFTIIS